MDAPGNTPLMTQIESVEMASPLLINGASALDMGSTGVMALHLATDNSSLTKDLLDRGATGSTGLSARNKFVVAPPVRPCKRPYRIAEWRADECP
jgi:hypothetical protein